MTALNKQALKPGLYAILFRNNWDGEGDTYEMLASLDENLIWHNYETGKELFEYEGDEILKSWLLNDSTTTDAQEAAEKRIAELQSKSMRPVAWMRSDDITTFGPIFTKNENYAVEQWGDNAVALYASPVNFKLACFTDERNLKYINERGRETSLIWSERNSENGDVQLFRAAGIGVKGE